MSRLLILTLALAACAAPDGGPPPTDDLSDVCVAAVAEHVDRPVSDVVVEDVTPDTVAVRDGDRHHVCTLENGSVRSILHPGAA